MNHYGNEALRAQYDGELWLCNHWGPRWSVARLEGIWLDAITSKIKFGTVDAVPMALMRGVTCTKNGTRGRFTGAGLAKSLDVGVFWLQGQDVRNYYWNDVNTLEQVGEEPTRPTLNLKSEDGMLMWLKYENEKRGWQLHT